jgi:hypothetical protein
MVVRRYAQPGLQQGSVAPQPCAPPFRKSAQKRVSNAFGTHGNKVALAADAAAAGHIDELGIARRL